jgi:hypothetical protein
VYNVGLNDLAFLAAPLLPENVGRVCKVVEWVLDDPEFGRFWRCTFTTPIQTVIGLKNYAILNDKQLRRLVGPATEKFAEERKEIYESA